MEGQINTWICITCGVEYGSSENPPPRCPVCEDERQYVGWNGQQWTTLAAMRQRYRNVIEEVEPALHSLRTEPQFAIGQRAFLLQSPQGNTLWDCLTLFDDATAAQVRKLGGIARIAVSHPHFYSSMVEWSRAFGGAPIHLHAADREWVMRRDGNIEFWEGEQKALPGGLALIRCGGHFEGFQVLHWPGGADGKGALLAGDQPQVAMDRRWVTFLYSYPNMIPLGGPAVRRIVSSLAPYGFDRIYGAFGRNVETDAKGAVNRSAERYLRFIGHAPARVRRAG